MSFDGLSEHRTRILALVLAVSVLLRVGDALYLGNAIEETRGGTHDQISYDALAQRVANGYGFSFARDWWPYVRAGEPTSFWSYLYTSYLAAIYCLFGHQPLVARLIQAVAAGLLTPWLLWRIGTRSLGWRVGLIAAAIAAVYFYFVHYAASLMTEAFCIIGILWTVDAAMRLAGEVVSPGRRAGAVRLGVELGAAMGMTLLLRQVIAFFLAVLALWLLWTARRVGRVQRLWRPLVVTGIVAALVILPWVVRNYRLFQRWTMPNTNAGSTFFWANHPIYGTRFEAVLSPSHGMSYQELIPSELRGLDEAALDRVLLARGLAFVLEDPRRYVLLSLSRIPVFFLFWPTADSTLLSNAARVLSFGLLLPFELLGLVLALRCLPARRTPGTRRASGQRDPSSLLCDTRTALRFAFMLLFLLFMVTYTAVHLASWAHVRYRLPVDAFGMLFAGYAVEALCARQRARCERPGQA